MKPRLLQLAFVLSFFLPSLSAEETREVNISKLTGEQIYFRLCADCHGKQGEGVAGEYEEPLTGDWPLEKLADTITRTMPEDDEESCVGEDSERVAKYIHDAFYSPEAQARNRPPRILLSRLTQNQYLNSVTDLLQSFFWASGIPEKRGLEGSYFDDRRFSGDKKVYDRIDPTIDFDYGEGVPEEEKFNSEAFAISWTGSVIAEETGEYEFIVESQNGVRLRVNDMDEDLIDGWVSTGKLERRKAKIPLLAKRPYRIRLQFFTYKEETASVRLLWKPSHGVEEVIPARNLIPKPSPFTYVVRTAFPPDDSSTGYERGISVSQKWNEATTYAAIEVANLVSSRLGDFTRSKPEDEDYAEKVKELCRDFVERAFRRPLSDEQAAFFVDRHFEATEQLEEAVKRVVILALKSPRFLYPTINLKSEPDDYEKATRLALGLWDSLPDKRLRETAEKGHLSEVKRIRAEAERMLEDPRAKAKMQEFFIHWLQMDRGHGLAKDAEAYPGFEEAIVSDFRKSLLYFVEDLVWSESSDYRELLRADELYLNERLAKFLRREEFEGAGFQKVEIQGEPRAGVLTHPYLLTAFSYHNNTSPIHRGVFLTRHIVGRALKPPPEAVEFEDSEFDPSLTMREKVAELTKAESCQTCHSIINPLGFSLENYDAVGRYRTSYGEKPVDAESVYTSLTGSAIQLKGPKELAEHAANSKHAHDAFVEELFKHVTKQPVGAFGFDTLAYLREFFVENDFNIRTLLVEIAVVHTLHAPIETETSVAQNEPD